MKYIKALSLAAGAALVLTASVGISSASAKICSTAGTGAACAGSHGNEYTGAFDASLIETTGGLGTHAVLTTGFVQVTCTGATWSGTVTNSATGTGDIEAMTFGGCTNNVNGGSCTASTTASATNKWHLTAVTEIAPTGRLEIEHVTTLFTCNILGANRTCRYTKEKVGQAGEIRVFGSDTTPTIEVSEVPLELDQPSDGLCSSTAKEDGRYEITSPTSLFLT